MQVTNDQKNIVWSVWDPTFKALLKEQTYKKKQIPSLGMSDATK